MTRIAVVVPVYNEAPTVRRVLEDLASLPIVQEIIVVDDGSTDATPLVIDWWKKAQESSPSHLDLRIVVKRHARNLGKGWAIRTGMNSVTASVVTVQDADLEYDCRNLDSVVAPVLGGCADVTYGSRFLTRNSSLKQEFWCGQGVRFLNRMVWWLYGVQLTDEATCYKVFRTEMVRNMALECERFEFCPEVTAKACRMGARIVEVAIDYRPRSRAEGKKIRYWDGIEAIWTLWRLRHWNPAASCALPSVVSDNTSNTASEARSHVV